ncbi:hypothetical protein CAEBREN_09344 [Caenorhabditis brenneri]|uniref:Uncharacterized protein n=1 Tax=Caenorhabditis brenneri TaxID=135651 RepID=G0N5W8_CAEBE|nr:hypothetical protein CAEBREN_09344 [Caenorhabditis brenneri]
MLKRFIQHDLLVDAIFNYDEEKCVTKVQDPEELHNYEQGNCHVNSSYSTFQLPSSPRQFMHPEYYQQQPDFKLQNQSCEVTDQGSYSIPETSNTSQTLDSPSFLLHPQETAIQPAIPFYDNHDADSTSQTSTISKQLVIHPDSTVPETYKSDQVATPPQTSTVVDQKSFVSYCSSHPTPLQPLVHQKSTMSESSQWMSRLITQFALVIIIIALLQIALCAVQYCHTLVFGQHFLYEYTYMNEFLMRQYLIYSEFVLLG